VGIDDALDLRGRENLVPLSHPALAKKPLGLFGRSRKPSFSSCSRSCSKDERLIASSSFIGFDRQSQSLWHVLGQFRYGTASKNKPLNFANASPGGTTVSVNGTQNLREDHWLVDFGVGRDFGLGNGNAMWTLGVLVADLRSKLTSNANFTAKTFTATSHGATASSINKGTFSAQEKATFVGAGPRFGVQGDIPLGGQWSIDWLAGAAVLLASVTFS
jgi:hypothetical protein